MPNLSLEGESLKLANRQKFGLVAQNGPKKRKRGHLGSFRSILNLEEELVKLAHRQNIGLVAGNGQK